MKSDGLLTDVLALMRIDREDGSPLRLLLQLCDFMERFWDIGNLKIKW